MKILKAVSLALTVSISALSSQSMMASDYIFFSTDEYDNQVSFWSPGDTFLPASKNSKWGYVVYDGSTRSAKLVVPMIYDEAHPFGYYQGYGLVRKDKNWYLMDKNLEIVSDIGEHEKVELLFWKYAKIQKDNKWALVDLPNEFLTGYEYDNIGAFGRYRLLFFVKRDGKWGLIDDKNTLKTAINYYGIHQNECSRCDTDNKGGYADFYVAAKDADWQHEVLIDVKTGRELTQFEYTTFSDISADGNYVIAAHYNPNRSESDKPNGFGIVNKQGKIVIPTEYSHIGILNTITDKTFFKVRTDKVLEIDKNTGMIDENNQVVLPFEYDSIYVETYRDKDVFLVGKDDKYGIFDLQGKIIFPIEYEYSEVIYQWEEMVDESMMTTKIPRFTN